MATKRIDLKRGGKVSKKKAGRGGPTSNGTVRRPPRRMKPVEIQTPGLPPMSVWKRICELDEARDVAIKREHELIEERKSIDAELRENGEDHDAIARWGEIQRDELPAVRAAKNYIANQMQRQIKLAKTPDLLEDADGAEDSPLLFKPIELGKYAAEQKKAAAKRAEAADAEDGEDGEDEDADGENGLRPGEVTDPETGEVTRKPRPYAAGA